MLSLGLIVAWALSAALYTKVESLVAADSSLTRKEASAVALAYYHSEPLVFAKDTVYYSFFLYFCCILSERIVQPRRETDNVDTTAHTAATTNDREPTTQTTPHKPNPNPQTSPPKTRLLSLARDLRDLRQTAGRESYELHRLHLLVTQALHHASSPQNNATHRVPSLNQLSADLNELQKDQNSIFAIFKDIHEKINGKGEQRTFKGLRETLESMDQVAKMVYRLQGEILKKERKYAGKFQVKQLKLMRHVWKKEILLTMYDSQKR